MNGLGKSFRKKSDPKYCKTVNNQSKITTCEQKSLARKRNFVPTQYSHSNLKLERKNFKPQSHTLFRSTSCFGVTKITTPI